MGRELRAGGWRGRGERMASGWTCAKVLVLKPVCFWSLYFDGERRRFEGLGLRVKAILALERSTVQVSDATKCCRSWCWRAGSIEAFGEADWDGYGS